MALVNNRTEVPDEWDDDCPQKRTKVEVLVDSGLNLTLDYDDADGWLEIPISEIETWVSQAKSADVKRTSKIRYPMSIHGQSVHDVLKEAAGPVSGIARTFHKDGSDSDTLVSLGYLGSVGGTGNPLEGKCWIYDFAEVCKQVYVTETFNDPSATEVLRTVVSEIIDNTFVPLSEVRVRGPSAAESFAADVTPDGLNEPDGDTSYYGIDTGNDFEGQVETFLDNVQVTVDPLNTAGDIEEGITETVTNLIGGATGVGFKNFRAERDTVVDILNWLADRLGAKWHFEPNGSFVTLVIDVGAVRRRFIQEELLFADTDINTITGEDPFLSYHGTVTVELNDALFESKPVNTVEVRGKSKRSLLKGTFSFDSVGVSVIGTADEFPIVKVRATPLYEAANEYELGPEGLSSDATTKAEATNDAISKLQKRISEAAAGGMRLRGNPYLNPYDRVEAFETCNSIADIAESPVAYEVAGVKHVDSAHDFYRTELEVTPYVGTENIEVVDRRMGGSDD